MGTKKCPHKDKDFGYWSFGDMLSPPPHTFFLMIVFNVLMIFLCVFLITVVNYFWDKHNWCDVNKNRKWENNLILNVLPTAASVKEIKMR